MPAEFSLRMICFSTGRTRTRTTFIAVVAGYVFLPPSPLWVDPVRVDLKGDMALYSSPPPGSGVLVAAIMKVLDGLSLESLDRDDPTSYHLITEALKHAYGQRTKLGDPRFVPQVNEVLQSVSVDGS